MTKSRNLFKGLQGPIQSYENYEIYENCEIYDNSQDHYKTNDIYTKCCREGPSKVTKITKITKFTKCEIYNYSQDHLQNLQNLLEGTQGRPIETYKNCENYESYDNSLYHLQNQRNLSKGLQGRPSESYENWENYKIFENCEICWNSLDQRQNQWDLGKLQYLREIASPSMKSKEIIRITNSQLKARITSNVSFDWPK